MFQSGKTTFSKAAKPPAIHIPTNPAMTKRQQELHKQVSYVSVLQQAEQQDTKFVKEARLWYYGSHSICILAF